LQLVYTHLVCEQTWRLGCRNSEHLYQPFKQVRCGSDCNPGFQSTFYHMNVDISTFYHRNVDIFIYVLLLIIYLRFIIGMLTYLPRGLITATITLHRAILHTRAHTNTHTCTYIHVHTLMLCNEIHALFLAFTIASLGLPPFSSMTDCAFTCSVV